MRQSRTPSLASKNFGASWLSPELKGGKDRLLFIAGIAELDIYRLPDLKHLGTVGHLGMPYGECADNNGNIWVANADFGQVNEFSHSGARIGSLAIPYNDVPMGCAVSPNGDLAVTADPGAPGNTVVVIYPHASGQPYSIKDGYYAPYSDYAFDGYDPQGNLYFDGMERNDPPKFLLFKCAAPCSASSTVSFISFSGGTIYSAGMVEWDKRRQSLAVGDRQCQGQVGSCVYWLKQLSQDWQIESVTVLKRSDGQPICDVVQATINRKGDRLVGADNEVRCVKGTSAIYRWPLKSGIPLNGIAANTGEPQGAAISEPSR